VSITDADVVPYQLIRAVCGDPPIRQYGVKASKKNGLPGCWKKRLFRLRSVRKFRINDDRAVKAAEADLAALLF